MKANLIALPIFLLFAFGCQKETSKNELLEATQLRLVRQFREASMTIHERFARQKDFSPRSASIYQRSRQIDSIYGVFAPRLTALLSRTAGPASPSEMLKRIKQIQTSFSGFDTSRLQLADYWEASRQGVQVSYGLLKLSELCYDAQIQLGNEVECGTLRAYPFAGLAEADPQRPGLLLVDLSLFGRLQIDSARQVNGNVLLSLRNPVIKIQIQEGEGHSFSGPVQLCGKIWK